MSKKEFVFLAMYLFIRICLCGSDCAAPKPNSEPGHTPIVVLTVHESGSNELLFGVFISQWNVLPDVYLAALNAEQNSAR